MCHEDPILDTVTTMGIITFLQRIACHKFTIIAGSKRNHSTQTFGGVDVMGERLAEEVLFFCLNQSHVLLSSSRLQKHLLSLFRL